MYLSNIRSNLLHNLNMLYADIGNGNGSVLSTPVPERIKSAPTSSRHDIMATPTTSLKGQSVSLVHL